MDKIENRTPVDAVTVKAGMVFIVLFFIVETYFNSGIPLLLIISGVEYDYSQYGIPVFHVIFVGGYSAFSLYCWQEFLSKKKLIYFFCACAALIISLLIMNRGAFLISFISMFFLYMSQKGSIKKISISIFIFIFVFYGFGLLGEKRMAASGYVEDHAILKIGDASSSFLDSKIPNDFFWGYLYLTSPLANLQYEISNRVDDSGKFTDLIGYQIFPDFISKRLYTEEEIQKFLPLQIAPELNVTTFYGKAYQIFGWFGCIFMFIWYLSFCYFFLFFFKRSKYKIAVYSILSAMSALLIFDNMLVFSGCLFQLFWFLIIQIVPAMKISYANK